ncbi:hypothetical protein [Massilia sp. BSC265]|uniref:hypothetical protein n=1 Tax=Massilia sp. BSC265 TaxID=1549812 RepID=UPI00126A7430|nr:hypothetical protein [Massilia sp. BSC265]
MRIVHDCIEECSPFAREKTRLRKLVEPDFVAVEARAPVTALVRRFHDGAKQVFVVDGEGRLAGRVQPGDLLVGLDLGVMEGGCVAAAPEQPPRGRDAA